MQYSDRRDAYIMQTNRRNFTSRQARRMRKKMNQVTSPNIKFHTKFFMWGTEGVNRRREMLNATGSRIEFP